MLLISIIIPSYNRAHLIRDTLESVLDQTYKNWECIIIDDGSTDDTIQVVKEYLEKDEKIHFYQRPENRVKGANACRNIGMEKSTGTFLQFLDSDDILSSKKLEQQISALSDGSDVAYGAYRYFTSLSNIADSKKISKPYYRDYDNGITFLNALGAADSFVPSHAYLVRKKVVQEAGFWDESLKSNQDGEFFTRVLLSARNIKFVANTTVYYRMHQEIRQSGLNSANKLRERIKSWRLIEKHLNKQNHYKTKYVESAKMIILRKTWNHSPLLVFKNFLFFKSAFLKKLKSKFL